MTTFGEGWHRLKLPLVRAHNLLKQNAMTCQALMDHLDECEQCKALQDLCEVAKPLYEAYRVVRVRSKWYFGGDVDVDKVSL